MSYGPESDFIDAIIAAGLTPPNKVIGDGKFRRFSTNGKASDKAGWYLFYQDGIAAGAFGDWRSGFSETWCSKPDRQLTTEQRAENTRRIKAAQEKARRQQEADRKEAEAKAAKLWASSPEADADHQYLAAKGVQAHGLRQSGKSLLVPVMDADGHLMSLQSIDVDGRKKFFPGCTPKGSFHLIGEPGSRVLVAEGYATGATLHEATGLPVAVAFNCGNLQPVAETIRAQYPDVEIVLAGDDDVATDGNPGRTHAEAAARSVNGKVVLPDFGASRPDGVTDFNDLAGLLGLDAVRDQVNGADLVEWPDPEPLTVSTPPEEYPADALPELLRAAVIEVERFTQAPLSLVAGSALSALSLAAQALADVQRAEGLSGPCSLFFLTVAESGERKTTVDGHFLDPIREWERNQIELAKPDLQAWQGQMTAWEAVNDGHKAKVRQLTRAGKSALDHIDLLEAHEAVKPEKPRVPKLLRVDATPESLGFELATEWPCAGLITSEGGSLFGSHGMSKDSIQRNLALLNTLWDGKPHPVSRRTSESYTVQGARLTVGVQVQQAPLRDFMRQSPGLARGMGFFSRFLMAIPESTQGSRLYRDPPASWPALTAFQRRLTELLDTPQSLDADRTLSPPMLMMAPEAKAAWVRFHDDVERELRPVGELAEVRDVASKAADNVARLACLFHLLTYGAVGEITAEEIIASAHIVAWHLTEARRFFATLALPADQANAETLDTWLIARCREVGADTISTRDISQYGPNAIRQSKVRDATLGMLEEAGRIRVETERRQKRVRLNPALIRL